MRPRTPARSALPAFFAKKSKTPVGGKGGAAEEVAEAGGRKPPFGKKGKKRKGKKAKKQSPKVTKRVSAMMAGPFGRAVMGATPPK